MMRERFFSCSKKELHHVPRKTCSRIPLGKVKAAVWQNATENGIRFNVTFSRIYKTEKGWESSFSFGRDELPLVSKVADLAHTWIYEQNERSDVRQSASGNSERRASKATA